MSGPGSGAREMVNNAENDTARLIKRIAELEARLYMSHLEGDVTDTSGGPGLSAQVSQMLSSAKSLWNAADRCVRRYRRCGRPARSN